MRNRALLNTPSLTGEKSLKTLVENRSVYSLDNCELNLFETYQESALVPLKFNDLVVTSMLRGKKVMHLFEDPEFDYLPGETVIVPSNVEMKIDFPEASFNNPTQCLALAIDHDKIISTLHFLNERYPKEDAPWELNYKNYFFYNNTELAATINKLIKECMSTYVTKDALVDISLQELLIRIVQTQTVQAMDTGISEKGDRMILQIAEYIRQNVTQNISLTDLSEKSCMSTTSFYRYFKKETGMSPIEFIMHEKIKQAKQLLKNPAIQVNEVSYQAGFEDCNYFIRVFKKYEGITPKQYQTLQISH